MRWAGNLCVLAPYGNAAIQGRLLKDVVVLPRYTLQSNNIIWTDDNEGRLRPKTLEVLTINGDNVYISAGLGMETWWS